MEIIKIIKTGKIIPISLEIVLFLDSSPSMKRKVHTIKDAKIAPKENKEIFKNLADIGTKKKIITIKHGT